jgi:predicted amidohydrolase YtcJ
LAAAKVDLGGEAGLAEAIADLQGYRQALSETEEAGRVLDREIEELASKISQIAPDEEAEALERFRKTLKAMGIEGVEAAENSEELIKILKQLDRQALEPVN